MSLNESLTMVQKLLAQATIDTSLILLKSFFLYLSLLVKIEILIWLKIRRLSNSFFVKLDLVAQLLCAIKA